MLRLTHRTSHACPNSRSLRFSTSRDHTPNSRPLRVEPLEDRRMLSVTLFVDADAPTGGDGLAWDSAYHDLQAALDAAGTRNADSVAENDVDQIWIAEGVYRPSAELEAGDPRSATFSLVDGVTLHGGFSGTETALEGRDWSVHVTTLSGDLGTVDDSSDNAYTVVYCGDGVEAGVDGVWVVDGNADGRYDAGRPERRSGGGICSFGALTVTDSTLSDNSASDGGGLYSSGTLTVTNSTLSGNSAEDGGGINSSGTLTVTNSTISRNHGSGIRNSGTLTVTNSTLSGNSAEGAGGGIYNIGTLTVTSSTISGNLAAGGGGIVSVGSSSTSTTLNNTIVAGNAAPSSPDILYQRGVLSGAFNLIGDGSDQSFLVHGVNGNQVGTADSPIDPLLSDLAPLDNGQWGYHLLPGSPALDAGNNALAVNAEGQPLAEDLSGSPRIQNETVDIGALEGTAAGTPGQTYVVTSLDMAVAEDEVLTFLEAIEAANRNQPVGDAPAGSFTEPDIIRFADGLRGTILVEDGELVIEGDLSIEGPGAELLAFDAGGNSRVFLVRASVSASLSGVTITGGLADQGGGIYNASALTVANSTIAENVADDGGGMYNLGTLTVIGSTISENRGDSRGYGGGIYSSGMLTITHSTISKNVAGYAGGIYNNAGTLTVTGSTISENSTSYRYGGGIYNNNGGTATITGSTISGNSAKYDGGGICSTSTLTVTNSTISGNSADGDGGGIYSSGHYTKTTLNNTIVAGNTASSGPDIYRYGTADGLSGSHNLIGNGSRQSSFVHGDDGNLVGTASNPIDPLLSDWVPPGRWTLGLLRPPRQPGHRCGREWIGRGCPGAASDGGYLRQPANPRGHGRYRRGGGGVDGQSQPDLRRHQPGYNDCRRRNPHVPGSARGSQPESGGGGRAGRFFHRARRDSVCRGPNRDDSREERAVCHPGRREY